MYMKTDMLKASSSCVYCIGALAIVNTSMTSLASLAHLTIVREPVDVLPFDPPVKLSANYSVFIQGMCDYGFSRFSTVIFLFFSF